MNSGEMCIYAITNSMEIGKYSNINVQTRTLIFGFIELEDSIIRIGQSSPQTLFYQMRQIGPLTLLLPIIKLVFVLLITVALLIS